MGCALGFHRDGGMLVDQNKCAYIAYWKMLAKPLSIFVYLCFEIHNFHLCGTPDAFLVKNMLTPHISDLRKARFVFNQTCSENFPTEYH